ncbi:hypothetical protein SAMN05444336_10215 [Albimonas donghaensis]|uniref:YMGG-like Gly-zipper domain-containing protein n=1 Tax=Albimonas donghaensis TaxID=356660 RepID=A0A1H2VBG9_9RHOB|nr:YMGG-like glycine zipper-containing protein [Albimonas donghaensis]SDW65675.1 hypothetical protein SAMN05444336_10215 [Albimonas donghaensis]
MSMFHKHGAGRRSHKRGAGRRMAMAAALAAGFGAAGCENIDETSATRTGQGAAVGAATGAVIGVVTGDFGDALITGAAIGAAGGFLTDQVKKAQ